MCKSVWRPLNNNEPLGWEIKCFTEISIFLLLFFFFTQKHLHRLQCVFQIKEPLIKEEGGSIRVHIYSMTFGNLDSLQESPSLIDHSNDYIRHTWLLCSSKGLYIQSLCLTALECTVCLTNVCGCATAAPGSTTLHLHHCMIIEYRKM